MRGIHPQSAGRALGWLALVIGLAGCQGNKQTASINPFLSPDRVPPPATRTVLPGTAQPYYPGDPLPSMQSTTGAPAIPSAPVPSPAITLAAATSAAASPTADSAKLAFSNERQISIPTDSGALRFERPAAPGEPALFTPPADSAPIAAAGQAATPTNVSRSAAITQATFQQPIAQTPTTATASFITPTSPWRSPQPSTQGPSTTSTPQRDVIQTAMEESSMASPWTGTPASNSQPATMPPIATPPATMDVRLRAVPSPVQESGGAPSPRIRMPSYAPTTQTFVMPDGSIEEVTYTPVETAPPGPLQSVAITPLSSPPFGASAPSPQLATMDASQSSQTIARRDGFRPRGSMR